MNDLTWTAWKVGKTFSQWHRVREKGFTICGRTPDGIISHRITPPSPDQECRVCRWRDLQEQRKVSNP